MRTITKEVFYYDELSEEAQQTAYEDWAGASEYPFDSENQESLEEFCKAFDVKVGNYRYGGYAEPVISWDFVSNYYDYDAIDTLSPVRLRTWIVNNYGGNLYSSKIYRAWNGTKSKKRYSKIKKVPTEFTGYFLDWTLLKPIWDFLEHPYKTTFTDLIDECMRYFIADCDADWNACFTMEYFKDEAESNGYEFYENGKRY